MGEGLPVLPVSATVMRTKAQRSGRITTTPHLWPRNPETVSHDFDFRHGAETPAGASARRRRRVPCRCGEIVCTLRQRYDSLLDHFHDPRRRASVPAPTGRAPSGRVCQPPARPASPARDTPKISEATTDSLMQASSSSFSTRFFSAVRGDQSCTVAGPIPQPPDRPRGHETGPHRLRSVILHNQTASSTSVSVL